MQIGKSMMYWLKVVSLGLVLGLGIQFAQAWVPPSTTPPGVNVKGPITTSSIAQTKIGGITANYLSAPTVCVNGDCRNAWPSGGGGGDNLGNHIANQNLNMSGNDIVNVNQILTNGIVHAGGGLDTPTVWAQSAIWTGGGVYAEANMSAKDYYIRDIDKWASQLGGISTAGMYECPYLPPAGNGDHQASSSNCVGQITKQAQCHTYNCSKNPATCNPVPYACTPL